ncbi:MAG: hypothetical protein IJ583_08765 [Firmicutes bacterium]|nr:hypothetical protein [Bacillota bacterium]
MKKQHDLIFYVTIIFILTFIIHSYFALFDKKLGTYNDELRYLQMANNFWNTGNFNIYNSEHDFQKIFYSLFLAPFYIIKNSIWRIRAISVFNAFLVSSSIFPAYLIAKKITSNKTIIIISLVVMAMFPDMIYSMTFMSENLYLPMGLWQIYFSFLLFMCENKKKKIIGSALLGIYSYLLYLTKEVSLIFIISYIIIEFCISVKKRELRILIPCLLFLLLFGISFLTVKSILFSGMGNSYNQTDITGITSPEYIKYFIYAFVYNLLFVFIGYFVFPIFYPLIRFKEMDKNSKILYLYTILNIIICLLVVTFTISSKEDFGNISPRQHHRYYSPLFFPVILVFINNIFSLNINNRKKEFALIIFSYIIIIAVFFIPQTPSRFSDPDSTLVKYYIYFSQNGSMKYFSLTVSVFSVICCMLMIKNKIKYLYILVAIIISMQIFNYRLTYVYFMNRYSLDHSLQDEAYRLDNFLNENNGNILYIQSEWYNDYAKTADTYISKEFNSVYIKNIDLHDIFGHRLPSAYAYAGNKPVYFCLDTDYKYLISDIRLDDIPDTKEISIDGVYHWYIYEVIK